MTMYQSDNGRWYGTLECLLLKIVTPEDEAPYTEVLVGTRAPFGGITVADTRGLVPQHPTNRFWRGREESVAWWGEQGFTITMPAMFDDIVNDHREARS